VTPRAATRRDVRRYVERWATALQLQPWHITTETVAAATLDDGSLAQVACDAKNVVANMTVAIGRAPGEVEASVAHECLHIAVEELTATASVAIERLSPEAREVAREHVWAAEERLVCRLERMVRRLKLIADVNN
jgi:hypothetical protein